MVGSAGFLVDAGVLMAATGAGIGVYAARVLSISLAGLVTWHLNRTYTFGPSGRGKAQEGGRYAAGLLLGTSLNYAIFAALTLTGLHPLLALIIASGAVMVFSYVFYRFVVFQAI